MDPIFGVDEPEPGSTEIVEVRETDGPLDLLVAIERAGDIARGGGSDLCGGDCSVGKDGKSIRSLGAILLDRLGSGALLVSVFWAESRAV